jgi:threonine synthase
VIAVNVIRVLQDVSGQPGDHIGVLTGNVLKDPDYIYGYHTGQLKSPDGARIAPTFGNKPEVVPNDPDVITRMLERIEPRA